MIYLAAFLLYATTGSAQKQFNRKSIYFESDKSVLNAESKVVLDQLFDSISVYRTYHIHIRGNTDNTGDSLYNIMLSQQRVEACRQYLARKGIRDSCFTISYFGENKPKASNETETGKQENRRVDIAVQYTRQVPQPEPSIRELYRQLAREKQEFCIRPDRDTTIQGEYGTIIRINANTFKVPAGCGASCVTFVLQEDYLKSDIIIDNLTTLWDNKVLESQAMFYTEARDCNGNSIAISRGSTLNIMTPVNKLKPNATLFDGSFTGHDSTMNWEPATDIDDPLAGFSESDISRCRDYNPPVRPVADCDCDFSCRIKRFDNAVAGWFSKCKRRDNKVFRIKLEICKLNSRYTEIDTARNLSKASKKTMLNQVSKDIAARNREITSINSRFPQCPVATSQNDTSVCENLLALFKEYGVNNAEELYDMLRKIKEQQRQIRLENGTANVNDLQYYAFSVAKLGWANCDLLASFPQPQKCEIAVDLKPGNNIDCKLVFKNKRTAIPFNKEGDTFRLKNLPKGEPAWIVALKYKNGKAFMFIQEIIAGAMTIIPVFIEYTLEELKEKLKMLDRK